MSSQGSFIVIGVITLHTSCKIFHCSLEGGKTREKEKKKRERVGERERESRKAQRVEIEWKNPRSHEGEYMHGVNN